MRETERALRLTDEMELSHHQTMPGTANEAQRSSRPGAVSIARANPVARGQPAWHSSLRTRADYVPVTNVIVIWPPTCLAAVRWMTGISRFCSQSTA